MCKEGSAEIKADCTQLGVTPQYSVFVDFVTELFSCVITSMYFADYCIKSFVRNDVLPLLLLLILQVFGVIFAFYFSLTFIELP